MNSSANGLTLLTRTALDYVHEQMSNVFTQSGTTHRRDGQNCLTLQD